MRKITKESPLPLHYQLKEILQEMIKSGELKPGDAIPPEREICEIQGVSRMTVNKAIMALVNEGIVYREQGRGTYVSKPKVRKYISSLRGFTDEMTGKGLKISAKILNFEIKEASAQQKLNLDLPDDENGIIELYRLRLGGNEPVSLETVYIPYYIFKGMDRKMIDGHSLYKIFRTIYKRVPKRAVQTIEPIRLSSDQCELLDLKKNSLGLLFKRTTYDENRIPIEYTECIYRSDNYKYEVILT